MNNQRNLVGLRFLMLGTAALAMGILFGVIGSFQFLFPLIRKARA